MPRCPAGESMGSAAVKNPMAPRPEGRDPALESRESRTPRTEDGTWLSLTYASAALALVASWGFLVSPTSGLHSFTFAALVASAFLAGRIAVPITPRSWYTMATPIVLLTGLVGGPIAGWVAGAATAVGDEKGTWRRRAAYGGLNSVQGFVAGLAGMITIGHADRALVCATLASFAFLVTNVAGRLLVGHVRGIDAQLFARPGTTIDAIETLVAIPVLALLLQSYDSSGSMLMLLTIGALLIALYAGTTARERFLEKIEEHFADARTDRLTGAPNRRAYDEELGRTVGRVVRGEHPAGLLVFDIDHFKLVNSKHTWTGGDQLLCAITARVGDVLRSTDHLSRRGGEEFCVIAPGVKDESALRELGEKVRGIVRMAPFAIAEASLEVTISVGATLIDGSLTALEADGLVNDALAEAKIDRDRLVVRLPRPNGDIAVPLVGAPVALGAAV
jgi:diguanylate cyclase (GGDEF)-like protein